MGLLATLKTNFQKGVKSAGLPMNSSYGNRFGGRSWFYGLLPGAQINYSELAGDRWRNSIVAASLSWIGRNLPQAPPCVYKMDAQGKEEIVPNHPLTALLKRPNKFYDGRTLRQATFLSLIAGRGANAYWWVKRNNIGIPMELWYLPHFDTYPVWTSKSTTDNWIEYYIYRVNGVFFRIENSDIIHFRDGMNPYNPRSGYDALESADREIVTDNEHSGYEASLMRNFGIPGAIISGADPSAMIDGPDQELLKAQFEEASQHDNRFRPIVLSGNVKVERVAFSPQDMMVETMAQKAETRVCAIIGVPAIVLGLQVGLMNSTYSNMEEARRAAWQDGIIPRLELINSECDTQLLPYFDLDPTLRTGADYRRVPALQETEDAKYQRITDAVGGPWLTRNEGRSEAGHTDIEGGDELYPPKGAGGMPGAEDDTKDPPPTKSREVKSGDGVTWITYGGRHIPIGEDGKPLHSGTHGEGSTEETPSPSAKSALAKQSAVYVGADIQRYAEEHNEPQFAKDVGGLSLRDNEPVDVIVLHDGVVQHGIELKTMVSNSNGKITMKTSAMEKKAAWMQKNHAPFHTVVFDDQKVFNANGQGKHGPDSDRQIYYKRGFGSFRVASMQKVKDMAELTKLLNTADADLPVNAKPPKGYPAEHIRKAT